MTRSRRGARILHGDVLLSEVPSTPRATGTPLDAMAAAATALAPGRRLALLGFAAGGLVSPLRALGFDAPIEAVDLSQEWEALFREVSDGWGGPVRLERAEASQWLRRRRRRYDAILEDLSEWGPDGVTKPWVSVAVLPGLIHRRLRAGGVAVVNLLPWPGRSWKALVAHVVGPFPRALLVTFEEYENRVLIAGERLPDARAASRAIRAELRRIRSPQAERIAVRRLR